LFQPKFAFRIKKRNPLEENSQSLNHLNTSARAFASSKSSPIGVDIVVANKKYRTSGLAIRLPHCNIRAVFSRIEKKCGEGHSSV